MVSISDLPDSLLSSWRRWWVSVSTRIVVVAIPMSLHDACKKVYKRGLATIEADIDKGSYAFGDRLTCLGPT